MRLGLPLLPITAGGIHPPVPGYLSPPPSASPQGYEGLVEGGDNIKQANWLSVSNIIQLVRVTSGPRDPRSQPLRTCVTSHVPRSVPRAGR